MISTVAWAVQPGQKSLNRPRMLVSELQDLGVIRNPVLRLHHGRTEVSNEMEAEAGLFNPARALQKYDEYAVLSPVFLTNSAVTPVWTDLYDDWSLAPDINPLYRLLAKKGYAQVRRDPSRSRLLTVNSSYLARRLGRHRVKLLPNGVDHKLSMIAQDGDDSKRLIIFGHFFPGRTDFKLIEKVIEYGHFSDVIVGGVGKDRGTRKFFAQLTAKSPVVQIFDWMSETELMRHVGNRTVALIPNLVNDYTLSQDLMKAYTFMALGIPTICPMPLWPSAIPIDYVFLTGHGDRIERSLDGWIESERPSRQWRTDFGNINSWRRRAEEIASWL